MDWATLVSGPRRPIIRLERLLPRAPSVVWRALTDPEELRAWFPCDIRTDAWRAGAPLRFVFRDGEFDDLVGTVIVCDEPRTLEFTWGDETLRFELTEVEGGTLLVFTDELDPPIAARNAAGWDVCLAGLEGSLGDLEAGPPDEGLWRERFEGYVASFVPVVGPQEGPPERA